MGKAQSKRSVDITTEVNKEGVVVEGESGKVGKIEDVDQLKPQLNGDTNPKDADSAEKQDEKKDDAENEKDVATEKGDQPAAEVVAAAVESDAGDAPQPATEATETAKPTENGNDTENVQDTTATTLNESKEVVEGGEDANATSTPVTDSNKKPKKEKSKKRFLSFRSFSFSKKDKQKPKKEENAANTTNGECEKVPEETTEEVAPATNGDEKVEAPTTNGTGEETTKVDDAKPAVEAPVATPEESVTPPIQEIKQVAKETVEEAIVAASKSVDEKINVVLAKPEVNAEKNTESSPVETIQNELNEKANVDTIANNITDNNDTDTITNSVGLGDCTNNINNLSPPPLPECPPPSQISVFAEKAMSVDETAQLSESKIPQSIPIVENQIQSDSILVGNAKIELNADEMKNEQSTLENDALMLANESENVVVQKEENTIESLPKPEEIAETIAILDNVNESEKKTIEEPSVVSNIVDEEIKSLTTEANTEPIKDDLSADISSPLQQNSLESLPSPTSNISAPSEVEENAATELVNEDLSLPPPPPVDDIVLDEKSSVVTESPIEQIAASVDALTLSETPLPVSGQSDAQNEINAIENGDSKTNGNGENHENIEVSATNGDSKLNGSTHVGDSDGEAQTTDKENGVKEEIATEKLNGDSEHKTIEEISPEKLEKLAAANPPPSQEVVASE